MKIILSSYYKHFVLVLNLSLLHQQFFNCEKNKRKNNFSFSINHANDINAGDQAYDEKMYKHMVDKIFAMIWFGVPQTSL